MIRYLTGGEMRTGESQEHSEAKRKVVDLWRRHDGLLLVRQIIPGGRRLWEFDLTDTEPETECAWPRSAANLRGTCCVFDVGFTRGSRGRLAKRIIAAVEVIHSHGISFEKREVIEQSGIPVIVLSTTAEHWRESDESGGSLVAVNVIVPKYVAPVHLDDETHP